MSIAMSKTGRWRRRATCTVASTAMIAAGFVAFAGPASAAVKTFYVDSGGADTDNCGTQIVQCATIGKAVAKAQTGDTVLVAAGTYKESVDIKSGITLKGVSGAADTIIDGDGVTTPNGLVNITQPGGDVTFTGFTVKNQSPSSNDDEFALTINDSSAADTITVKNNVFSGDGTDMAPSIGVDSGDTAATQNITGNEFSGLWEGILLEGSKGPVDVSDNKFHDLIPADAGDGATYPSKGIFFLGDKNVSATDQNVTNNDFYNYGGIGIDYRAGYDLGGCAGEVTCNGSISGSVTDNSFDLDAPADTNSDLPSQQPAAISLQSRYDGNELNLTIGGNTGTVKAPTQPILQVAGDGSTTITPGAAANTIVPDPAPTVAVTLPSSVTAGQAAQEGNVSVTNNSGEALSNVRYDFKITGTKGITASQVKLQYDADPSVSVNYQDVTLTGTANSAGGITGYFGPAEGTTLPTSAAAVVTGLRLSIPDASTPADSLKTSVRLDQVTPGTPNQVINILATSATATTVVSAPPPAAVNTVKVTLDPLVQPDRVQVANVQVTDVNGNAPATGTEVDLLVSGATVANGTVSTNSAGSARFLFRIQHAGSFTVKAVAGGKSGTITATTPLRHVTTALALTTLSKGVITVVGTTSPARPGVKVAIIVDQGGVRSFPIITVITDSKGVARHNITGLKSGSVYAVTVRVYGDPDSDSVNSPRMLIRVK